MPGPKRARPGASSTVPKKRASKLAKDNAVSAEQEAEIREAFDLFSVPDPHAEPSFTKTSGKKPSKAQAASQAIRMGDVRRCLVALNASTSSTTNAQITETLDPADVGYVTFDSFFAFAALKLNERAHLGEDDEDDGHDGQEDEDSETERMALQAHVREAFALFTRDQSVLDLDDDNDTQQQHVISIQHLRRVAKELREEIPDATIRDMIKEANGGKSNGVVTVDEFEDVMRRAGVFV